MGLNGITNVACGKEVRIDKDIRRDLSKRISKITKRRSRDYRTQQIKERLTEFSKLENLERIHMYPVTRKQQERPDTQKCAELLASVYTSNNETHYSSSCDVDKFTWDELQHAMK